MRSKEEIRAKLEEVDLWLADGDEETDDPAEAIQVTLLWVLEKADDSTLDSYITE